MVVTSSRRGNGDRSMGTSGSFGGGQADASPSSSPQSPVSGAPRVRCDFEILRKAPSRRRRTGSHGWSQGPYGIGITSTVRPECFEDVISQAEWAEKVDAFNAELHKWWSSGGRAMGAAAYALATAVSLVPCLAAFLALPVPWAPTPPSDGDACCASAEGASSGLLAGCCRACDLGFGSEAKRSRAVAALQPICDALSDTRLVWSIRWRDDHGGAAGRANDFSCCSSESHVGRRLYVSVRSRGSTFSHESSAAFRALRRGAGAPASFSATDAATTTPPRRKTDLQEPDDALAFTAPRVVRRGESFVASSGGSAAGAAARGSSTPSTSIYASIVATPAVTDTATLHREGHRVLTPASSFRGHVPSQLPRPHSASSLALSPRASRGSAAVSQPYPMGRVPPAASTATPSTPMRTPPSSRAQPKFSSAPASEFNLVERGVPRAVGTAVGRPAGSFRGANPPAGLRSTATSSRAATAAATATATSTSRRPPAVYEQGVQGLSSRMNSAGSIGDGGDQDGGSDNTSESSAFTFDSVYRTDAGRESGEFAFYSFSVRPPTSSAL